MGRVDRVDRYQREHGWVGFPLAVLYKLFDDRGPYLAALVTYYAFVSLFPLLLLFLSVTGFFLDGNPQLRQELIHAATQDFQVVGPQLRSNISSFHGSGIALTIGIVGTVYGALGMTQAAQAAFNRIYAVPRNEQPNPLTSRLRSLLLIALIGLAVLISTAIATVLSTVNGLSSHLGVPLRIAGYGVTFVINVMLFTGAFQLLTARELRVRNVITGGLIAGVTWEILQTVGSRYVTHEASRGNSLYGVFGVVLATLAWIYVQSLAIMLSAEINVVAHRRLWPRAFLTPFSDDVELTPADKRAYDGYVATQRYKGFQRVWTDYTHSPQPDSEAPSTREGADGGDRCP